MKRNRADETTRGGRWSFVLPFLAAAVFSLGWEAPAAKRQNCYQQYSN